MVRKRASKQRSRSIRESERLWRDAARRREGGEKNEREREREKRNKEKGVAVAGGDREKGRDKGRERWRWGLKTR